MCPSCFYSNALTHLRVVCVFFSGVNSRSARVLFLLVAPGHMVFLYTINSMQGGHTTLTYVFIAFYLAAALLQVYMSISVMLLGFTIFNIFLFWLMRYIERVSM